MRGEGVIQISNKNIVSYLSAILCPTLSSAASVFAPIRLWISMKPLMGVPRKEGGGGVVRGGGIIQIPNKKLVIYL